MYVIKTLNLNWSSLNYFQIHLFDLGLFWARLAQTLLWNLTNIDKQLLFSIGSPNYTLSSFPGWGVVGKCVTKENPKSDLDLDSGFVNI